MNNNPPEPSHRGGRLPVDNPSGRIVYTPPPEHDCAPSLEAPEGSIWKCDHCGSEWMAVNYRQRTEWLICQRLDHDAHQPIGRTVVVLLLILVAIGAGLAIIFTSG